MEVLYRKLAADLEGAIASGVFPPGTRMPSIRKTAERYDVSLSTAIEAYGLLEELDLVEARYRSGHFVKQPHMPLTEPAKSLPKDGASRVSIARVAMEVCALSKTPGIISLGPSFPGPDSLDRDRLAKAMARGARMNADQLVRLSPTEGHPPLRQAIARLLLERGAMVHEKDVFVTNGAQEALTLALRAVTRPGDTVAVESPVYFGILQAIEVLDLKVIELPTDPRKGADLEHLERVVASGDVKACILSPTYQNPLGFCMSETDKRRAVELLERYRVPLIEDDVYGQIEAGSKPHRPAKSYDLTGNVMHVGSFSKTISPSLRMGWILPGRNYDEIRRQKFLLNLNTSVAPQLTLAEYLRGNRFRKTTTAAARTYQARAAALRKSVLKHFPQGTRCTNPIGGLALWIEMPEGYSSMALAHAALEKKISIFPGWVFGAHGAYENCLRLSIGQANEQTLRSVAETLGKIARDCKEK